MSELTIKDFKSKYQPIGLSMELNFQGQSAYETGKIGGHTPLYTDEQIQDYLSNQPQLTIRKSIADEFDQIYEDSEEYQKNVAQMFSSMQPYFVLESYPEILHWLEDDVKNTNVALAYLAGKALGVDLVKVV